VDDEPNPPATGWTEDDAVIARLRAWLGDRGYATLSDHYHVDSFGNQEVVLARPIAIRLARDRGQWQVEVAGKDGQFKEIRRWRDALRESGPQLLSAADQAAILREMLDEIEGRPSLPDR
jgi:hypothetical protein